MRKLARKIIWLLNLLFAGLLLLSYSAPLISPAIILFPAFLGLAYPYLLLLNLAFIIYWTVKFRKEVLISLIVILTGWNHLMNLVPLNLNADEDRSWLNKSSSFTVMSYNVRTFDQYNWSKERDSFEGMFRLVNENNPDILCFQEFYTVNRKGRSENEIRNQLSGYPYEMIYYGLQSSPKSGIGIATFSKYPIIKTSRIPFSNSMNQAVFTDIMIENDTFRVFNIHLQSIRFRQSNYSFLDSLSLKYSNRQLEEVRDISNRLRDAFVLRAEQSSIIAEYIEDAPHPVIVTGDFNDTPTSYAYRKIKKGLTDAFRVAGKGLGNTYAGELPSYRIDYIFCSKELVPLEFNRIKTKYSDHFPVLARLVRKDCKQSPK